MARHESHSSWHAVLPFVLGLWAAFCLLVLRARGTLRTGSMQRFRGKLRRSSATTGSASLSRQPKLSGEELQWQPLRWPIPDQVITQATGRPPWDLQKLLQPARHTSYHRPSGIPAVPASSVPDEDADELPVGEIHLRSSQALAPRLTMPHSGLPRNWEILSPDLIPVEDDRLTPFIITRTEFYEDYDEEGGNQKIGITHYMGDGVLADDKDVPIRDSASVVGTDYARRLWQCRRP